MEKALDTLSLLITTLPEIKQTLGNDWSAFVDQLQTQTPHFKNLTDEAALTTAANHLLGLFLDDGPVEEIITRPRPEDEPANRRARAIRRYLHTRTYLDQRKPRPAHDIQAVANIFIDLTQTGDEAKAGQALEELLKQPPSATPPKNQDTDPMD